MMGFLEPSDDYVAASVCADHTGEEHPIAELLQAVDESREGNRTEAQYLESLTYGRGLTEGRRLDSGAEIALRGRTATRAAARRAIETGAIRVEGIVAWAD